MHGEFASWRLDRRVVITALGISQILAWGTSFYFPAVFSGPIVKATGWSLGWVVAGTTIGLLVAGLISPRVGRLIGRHGGRPVLLASSLCFAAGLVGVGLAPSLIVSLAAWLGRGLGMGTGLYDAVFAALGRMYGSAAREPITNLTLFGGFASTVCWPLSAFMIDHLGWRMACLIYAGLHLGVALPLQMAVVRATPGAPVPQGASAAPAEQGAPIANERLIFALVALMLSVAAGVGAIVVVHLLIFLQARGVDYTAAVALGTLFGPAQVGARVVERLFGGRYHPIWTMVGSCALMAIALLLLLLQLLPLALIILLYGAGFGVSWVGRGTLPLALFGPKRFPQLMGRLAFPSLITLALAPSVGAFLIEGLGAQGTVAVLTACAAVNLGLVGALWRLCPVSAVEA